MGRPRKKNYWKVFSTLVIIAAVLYVGYRVVPLFSKKKVETPVATDTQKTTPVQTVTTGNSDKTIKEDKDTYTIDITYPVLGGLEKTIASKANASIKGAMDTLVSDFKTNSVPEEGVIVSEKSTLDVSYNKTMIQTDTTLTVLFAVSDYFSGAAHPNNYTLPVTVSKTTGLRMMTKDFFKSDSNFLSVLSAKAVPLLKKKLGGDFSPDGATATSDNYDSVYLTDTNVVVLYDPCRVAACAAGVITIEIPKSQLQAILK